MADWPHYLWLTGHIICGELATIFVADWPHYLWLTGHIICGGLATLFVAAALIICGGLATLFVAYWPTNVCWFPLATAAAMGTPDAATVPALQQPEPVVPESIVTNAADTEANDGTFFVADRKHWPHYLWLTDHIFCALLATLFVADWPQYLWLTGHNICG